MIPLTSICLPENADGGPVYGRQAIECLDAGPGSKVSNQIAEGLGRAPVEPATWRCRMTSPGRMVSSRHRQPEIPPTVSASYVIPAGAITRLMIASNGPRAAVP